MKKNWKNSGEKNFSDFFNIIVTYFHSKYIFFENLTGSLFNRLPSCRKSEKSKEQIPRNAK